MKSGGNFTVKIKFFRYCNAKFRANPIILFQDKLFDYHIKKIFFFTVV